MKLTICLHLWEALACYNANIGRTIWPHSTPRSNPVLIGSGSRPPKARAIAQIVIIAVYLPPNKNKCCVDSLKTSQIDFGEMCGQVIFYPLGGITRRVILMTSSPDRFC